MNLQKKADRELKDIVKERTHHFAYKFTHEIAIYEIFAALGHKSMDAIAKLYEIKYELLPNALFRVLPS